VWTSTCRIAPKRGNSAADPFALPLFRRGGEAPRHDAADALRKSRRSMLPPGRGRTH
jgi:hypothetical protein